MAVLYLSARWGQYRTDGGLRPNFDEWTCKKQGGDDGSLPLVLNQYRYRSGERLAKSVTQPSRSVKSGSISSPSKVARMMAERYGIKPSRCSAIVFWETGRARVISVSGRPRALPRRLLCCRSGVKCVRQGDAGRR